MSSWPSMHPKEALFGGEQPFPIIAACEHFAGSEKLIRKGFELQQKLGPVFDITMDLEDGAAAGQEKAHAAMVAGLLNASENVHTMAGVRIHDPSHPAWQADIDIVIGAAVEKVAYITIPKPTTAAQVATVVGYLQAAVKKTGSTRVVPVHVLIETHGALREVFEIAAVPWLAVLDFGLMDFISGHHGAISASCMKSPGQFEHALLARAKSQVVAAALGAGLVPSHNVTLDLKNAEQTFADAKRAKEEFGFLRMWSIYPTQIQAIVDALAPNYAEVAVAADILLAAEQAAWGPIQHRGDLHDRATYRYFWELLGRAKLAGHVLPGAVDRWFT